jgi:hypothetical protein
MLLMPKSSIMTEKLARRDLHVHQDYEADVLAQARVAETIDQEFPRSRTGKRKSALHSPKGKVPGIRICIANRRRL